MPRSGTKRCPMTVSPPYDGVAFLHAAMLGCVDQRPSEVSFVSASQNRGCVALSFRDTRIRLDMVYRYSSKASALCQQVLRVLRACAPRGPRCRVDRRFFGVIQAMLAYVFVIKEPKIGPELRTRPHCTLHHALQSGDAPIPHPGPAHGDWSLR